MDWIKDHPQIILLALLGIGSLLKTLWEAKSKREQQPDFDPDREPREPVPLDEDKSYRKVERGMPPPMPRESGPPPLPQGQGQGQGQSQPGRAARVPPRRLESAAAVTAAQEEAAALLKHQQELAARLQRIRETKATTTGGAAATRNRTSSKKKKHETPVPTPQGLKARLKDRSEIRRAIVLREILDRPLGLR